MILRDARDYLLARGFLAFMWLVKLLPADAAIDVTGRLAAFFGMRHRRTAAARDNLRHAFPEKSPEEIEAILREMWTNLGRTTAEYAFLDRIFDLDPENPEKSRFEVEGIDNFVKLRELDGPAICFTAHTANWEVLPIGAAAYGLHITALFRPPNNKFIAREVLKARKTAMGHLVPSKAGAAWALSSVLDQGGKVGILADQYFAFGTPVTFFGRTAPANPLLAKLVKHYDCPVYPARTIRLPGGRFRLELGDALELPRRADGRVDEAALTQKVSDIMEGWIREYPGQWLWLHKRWRKVKKRRWKQRRGNGTVA